MKQRGFFCWEMNKKILKTVKKQISLEEYKKHFRNALHNYIPVLNIIDGIREKYRDGRSERMPEQFDTLLVSCYITFKPTVG